MEAETIPLKKRRWRWLTPELRIAIRICFCFVLFISIIDRWSKTGDRMEMVSNPAYLNFDYAKKIDVETYLMNRSQLKQLFQKPEGSFVCWEQNQTGILNDPAPLFLVVRLRNRGDSYAWGRLMPHSRQMIRGTGVEDREVMVQLLPPHMDHFETIILATSVSVSFFDYLHLFNEKIIPTITTEWTSLYASKQRGTDGR